MGFDSNLISEALRTLNLNGNEVSAQAINQCATWMIDHQANQPSNSNSSNNGWSLNPAIRSAHDIRNYFTSNTGPQTRYDVTKFDIFHEKISTYVCFLIF